MGSVLFDVAEMETVHLSSQKCWDSKRAKSNDENSNEFLEVVAQ